MKKLILCLLLITTSPLVLAYNDNFATLMERGQRQYYNHLYDCKEGTFVLPSIKMFGVQINFKYQVLGKNGDSCSFIENAGGSVIDCTVPMDIAKEYAKEGLKLLDETKNKQMGGYSSYINEIINDRNYCSINVEK